MHFPEESQFHGYAGVMLRTRSRFAPLWIVFGWLGTIVLVFGAAMVVSSPPGEPVPAGAAVVGVVALGAGMGLAYLTLRYTRAGR